MQGGAHGAGLLQYDPDLGLPEEKALTAVEGGASTDEASAKKPQAPKISTSEQPKVQPGTTNLRMALPWAPAVADQSTPASSAVVCQVQRSGACVPF
jgi:hypothetical protein